MSLQNCIGIQVCQVTRRGRAGFVIHTAIPHTAGNENLGWPGNKAIRYERGGLSELAELEQLHVESDSEHSFTTQTVTRQHVIRPHVRMWHAQGTMWLHNPSKYLIMYHINYKALSSMIIIQCVPALSLHTRYTFEAAIQKPFSHWFELC